MGLTAAVVDWIEKGGIESSDTGKHLSISVVKFIVGIPDSPEFARITDKDMELSRLQEVANPGRVGSGFQRHEHGFGRIETI
jgi:hypothetical protein